MDRPLDPDLKRRTRLRRAAAIVLPIAGLVALLMALPGWLRPSIARSRVRTAHVTVGSIQAVVSASGTVAPEVERVLSSPLDARVMRILKRPGTEVKQGDPVVELDVSQSVLALDKIVKDLNVKENQQAQTRLALEKSLVDLDGRIEVKTLEVQSLQTKCDSNQKLFTQGLVSREALSQSELAVKQAQIELVQLTGERKNAEQSTSLQFKGLSLERAALDLEATEARRLLDLATTKSDRDGVLTWVLSQEGALVRRGDVIARIADLTSFRVEATVSDVHAGRLRPGVPVIVKVNETELDGAIADVLPSVENGIVQFTVTLRERSHPLLRPNLRVDVFVVTDRKERTRKVKRGPFIDGSGSRQAFVVQGNRAVRTAIEVGVFGFDEIEMASGVNEGDEIVISDMSDYLHLKEVTVR